MSTLVPWYPSENQLTTKNAKNTKKIRSDELDFGFLALVVLLRALCVLRGKKRSNHEDVGPDEDYIPTAN